MKGDAKGHRSAQEVLKAELTAINQYFLHAEMCENWGYDESSQTYIRKESIEEMEHAEKLIERILFLRRHAEHERLLQDQYRRRT